MGPTLEARLYTLEMLCTTFDVSRKLTERGEACLVRPLPRPRAMWLAESQDKGKLAYYAYACSLAHARGGSRDEEKILLLPPLERLSYCLKCMSFSRFQYELLVHTPNTDVYRHILECRFTHFAPYVA